MSLILAIDGGGTRTRCLAIDRDGQVRGEAEAGPSNHLHVPIEAATEALRAATSQALHAASAGTHDVALVSAGLAGVDYDGSGAVDAARILRTLGFARVIVHSDMVIAHRAALAGAPGVVALAGTGSSVLGIGVDGMMVKAGGWGPVYGDQGSAYQLGRLGLTAAAEAFDGSGPPTALTARLTSALEAPSFPDTVTRIYAGRHSQTRVAGLARVVDACAEEGDLVARSICRQAGGDLARAVLAVLRRLRLPEALVSYQGAVVARSRLLRMAFVEALSAHDARVDVRPPRREPIMGAAVLGAVAEGWRWNLEEEDRRAV